MTLTELSVKRPTFVAVIFLILGIFGLIAANKIGFELFPKFDVPLLNITTLYPGASPEEVESEVTKKLEDKVSLLENIKHIRSISYEGLSVISIELLPGTNVDDELLDCQRKIDQALSDLPTEAKTPAIAKLATDGFPVLRFSVTADAASATELTKFLNDKIIPQISYLKGVSNILMIGGEDKAIRVNLDAGKLKFYHLSILQVTQAIGANNQNFPTGDVEDNTNNLPVKLSGKYKRVEDLRELVIKHGPDGGDVRLTDIGVAIEDKKTVRTISRINGKPAVVLGVLKQTDYNAVTMAGAVNKTVADLEKIYASRHLRFRTVVDNTKFTLQAADAVEHDLAIALCLVALVILIFLHSLRDSLIVMLAIPCSFFGTIIALYLFGYTFNLMTLLGLTLVVGILVDDSIVVLENIHRHLNMGKDKLTASIEGRAEIGYTAVAITMVDIIVFLPLALSHGGIASSIFRPFTWVVIISTLLSLFVSFTLTPLLSSRFATLVDLNKPTLWMRVNRLAESEIARLTAWYGRRLVWVLKHKRITIFSTLLLFVASMALVANGFIANTFVEQGQRQEALLYLETEKSSSLPYTDSLTHIAEAKLLAMSDVETVITSVGVSQGFFVASDVSKYRAELRVLLKKSTLLRDEEFVTNAETVLRSIPGAKIANTPINLAGEPNDKPVQVIISGDNADSVLVYNNKLKAMLASINGVADIQSSLDSYVPEVRVTIDKEKMVALGLNIATVGATMANAFHGNDDSKFNDGGTDYDIIVEMGRFDRRNPDDVGKLQFANSSGALIELRQFATILPAIGNAELQRTNKLASAIIETNLIGRQIGDVGPEVDKSFAAAQFPASIKITWIGDYANQQESGGIIGGAFGISFILIYFLMVILYNDFVYPLVVLFAIPMSFIGAFLALALAKSSLSLFTTMGLIVMMGLVCKNSILIVDFAGKEKAGGKNSFDALMAAGKERLRPILMTTIAMVLGMLPIAIASGAGSEWKNGLGWALVGGLTSSMCLTVFIVPAVYGVVDTIKERLRGRKSPISVQDFLAPGNPVVDK
jgi:HAE1 family hydrophobic/amphiphilic exporter-1